MANRIIVDKIDGVTHIFTDNGGNVLESQGVYTHNVHEKIIELIGKVTGKFLTDLDRIEYLEVENGKEKPVEIITMAAYLEK